MSKPDEDYNNSSSSIHDPLSEFEQLNPMDVLTSNETLDNIKIYDSTM